MPATTDIYTLSLHDALPILLVVLPKTGALVLSGDAVHFRDNWEHRDRKSTRLNSSHPSISYAVFCLKKKSPVQARPVSHRRRALYKSNWNFERSRRTSASEI